LLVGPHKVPPVNSNFFVNFSEDDDDVEQDPDDTDPNAGRFVRYQFTPQFLKLKTIGAT
jgi:hypothetical protein